MNGIKHTFQARISAKGVLQVNMTELNEIMRNYPNKQAVVTIEIMNQGDVQMMLARYRNHILPKVVKAWRELGENYTVETADRELRKHTTTCHQTWAGEKMIVPVDSLDRELLKQYLDEVNVFCSMNLSLIL